MLGPDSGPQACGEIGDGRMLEAAATYEAIASFFSPKILSGRRVLLTAGPTFEPLDPGLAASRIARAARWVLRSRARRRRRRRCISSRVRSRSTPWGVFREDVQIRPADARWVMRSVADADIFIGVAAVADWRVAHASEHKIKKAADRALPTFSFVENPDILAAVANLPHPPFAVGFAA